MKFLPPLLLCACFIYAGNGVAIPSGAAGIDTPAKIKHASFILELDEILQPVKILQIKIPSQAQIPMRRRISMLKQA